MRDKDTEDVDVMLEEIICVLRRNKKRRYLHHLLHCALAYEKALSK